MSDSASIARVHVDTWRTTYRGIVDQEFLDNMSYERRQQRWEAIFADSQRPTSTFVAIDQTSGQIVGFSSCGPARDTKDYDGELYSIYVLREFQGKGLGRRLVSSAADDLVSHGYKSMLVWVLADNPFARFYQSLGGTHVLTKDVEIGGKMLRESGYAWKDLSLLTLEPSA